MKQGRVINEQKEELRKCLYVYKHVLTITITGY